jgi:hypothetical protein
LMDRQRLVSPRAQERDVVAHDRTSGQGRRTGIERIA